jgi:pimeloyl-ACP methyl ester carboxylesterase
MRIRAALTALLLALVACNYPAATPETLFITATPAAGPTAPAAPTTAPTPGFTPQPTAAYTPRYEAAPCPPAAAPHTTECGVLIVPQDRTQPDGLQVRLPVVILRSRAANPAPDPVIHLSGGPGSPAISLTGYHLATGHDRFLAERDYILFDQRGTGGAQPSLACPERWDVVPQLLEDNPPTEEARAIALSAYEACLGRLRAAGVQPAHYSSAASAADVADLIRALGYERANLYGVSYGTRLALTVMRDHPSVVRSAILDSPYPPQVNLYNTWTQGTERAFEVVFTACAAQASCNSAHPNLRDRFYALVDALNAAPLTVTLQDPATGATINAQLTGDVFVDVMFTSLYRWDNIPRFPQTVSEVERGTVSDFTRRFLGLYLARSGSAGVTISVQCNEELAFSSMEALRRESAGVAQAINSAYVDSFAVLYASCPVWTPNAPNLPYENDPVTSPIPTLLLTGEVDPITPPAWGPLTAQTLPNSTVVEFPALGHWIMRSGQPGACAMSISLDFLADPTTPPDLTCRDGLPGLRFQ